MTLRLALRRSLERELGRDRLRDVLHHVLLRDEVGEVQAVLSRLLRVLERKMST